MTKTRLPPSPLESSFSASPPGIPPPQPSTATLRGGTKKWRTQLCGCSCRFSPWRSSHLAVGTSQHFGLAGGGAQCIIDIGAEASVPHGGGVAEGRTLNSILDCCWSEKDPSIIASALGDGHIEIFQIPPLQGQHTAANSTSTSNSNGQMEGLQSRGKLFAHPSEVASIDWNIFDTNVLISSGWDGGVTLWDMDRLCALKRCGGAHKGPAYSTAFSPIKKFLAASVGSDGCLRIYDTRTPKDRGELSTTLSTTIHRTEGLSLDWNRYVEYEIATGATDASLSIFDLRVLPSSAISKPQASFLDHKLAISCVRWSPHFRHLLATASYDKTVKVFNSLTPMIGARLTFQHHTEFVKGVDWSLTAEGVLGSVSWDKTVLVQNLKETLPVL